MFSGDVVFVLIESSCYYVARFTYILFSTVMAMYQVDTVFCVPSCVHLDLENFIVIMVVDQFWIFEDFTLLFSVYGPKEGLLLLQGDLLNSSLS